jgi:hypothetical protein
MEGDTPVWIPYLALSLILVEMPVKLASFLRTEMIPKNFSILGFRLGEKDNKD